MGKTATYPWVSSICHLARHNHNAVMAQETRLQHLGNASVKMINTEAWREGRGEGEGTQMSDGAGGRGGIQLAPVLLTMSS